MSKPTGSSLLLIKRLTSVSPPSSRPRRRAIKRLTRAGSGSSRRREWPRRFRSQSIRERVQSQASSRLLDRIEKADPSHAGVAPLRSRLNLLAAGVKIFPDQDLWPCLKGLTCVVMTDSDGNVSGGLLGLHTVDGAGAKTLFDRVLPRIAKASTGTEIHEPGPSGIQALGMFAGEPLAACRRETTVLLAWGRASMEAGLNAWDHPERSASVTLRESWGSNPPQRCGAFWPGRLREIVSPGTDLEKSLRDAPPVLWDGRIEGRLFRDQVKWTGLSGVVKRWLDALPLVTPPEH